MIVVLIVETLAIGVLGLLVTGLLRSHAEILGRLRELEGVPAPSPGTSGATATAATASGRHAFDVVGETPSGEAAAVGIPGAAHDTLLAFLSSGCATCAAFWEAFADRAALGLPDRTRLLVVTKSPDAESLTAIAAAAPPDLTVVMSTAAWLDYQVPGSPYFVLAEGASGRVAAEGTGETWDVVRRRLFGGAASASAPAPTPALPQDAPAHVDAALLSAGIGPGHPSLYPSQGGREENAE